MPPVAEPPPAPAAAPTNIMPGAAPEGRAQINVSTMPKSELPPPRPGSARARLSAELQKVADKPGPGKSVTPPQNEPTPKPDANTPPADAPPTEGAKPGEDPKKPKPSPWKLVEEYKAKVTAAEARILEIEKRAIPEADWKKTQETLTQREARLKELEDEIRYVNYSKSEEFKNKYQVPYEKQWQRTMSELGELTVEQSDGSVRSLTANDVLELVNLPLGKAHELATEKFGDLASEVMAHRKEIRKLFDEQSSALDDARKAGADREKTTAEQRQREYGENSKAITDTWSKANEEITADPKYGTYFTPVDGDQEGNQRLAKGFELADRAFSENPLAPGLNAEQRQAIVRRHAAVRNRAAAFGRLVYQNSQSKARITELEKIVAEFKGSSPTASGSQPAVTPSKAGTGMSRLMESLNKIAKPY